MPSEILFLTIFSKIINLNLKIFYIIVNFFIWFDNLFQKYFTLFEKKSFYYHLFCISNLYSIEIESKNQITKR